MKKIIKSISFIAILLVLLIISSFIFSPKNNTKEAGIHDVKANGILGEKENTIDVLIVGDSEAYSSISPLQMYNEYGFTSYNGATSAQKLYETLNYIEKVYKTQKPKIVLIEVNLMFRKQDTSSAFGSKFNKIFPVFEYHNRWKKITLNDLNQKIEYTWTDDNKGFKTSKEINPPRKKEYMEESKLMKEIPDLNYYYFKKIINTIKSNGGKILLYSAPSSKNWNYKKHNSITSLAEKYNLTYIDLNLEDIDIDWNTDTRDKGDHLNYYGAYKATAFIGKYLNTNYKLPNHKEDSNYSNWNKLADEYTSKMASIKK